MVSPRSFPTPTTPQLTGDTRLRKGWGGCLVLQVEEQYYYSSWNNDLPPSDMDKWVFTWRDAKIEDVTNGGVV